MSDMYATQSWRKSCKTGIHAIDFNLKIIGVCQCLFDSNSMLTKLVIDIKFLI